MPFCTKHLIRAPLALASDIVVAGSTTEVIHATARSAHGDTLAGRAVAWSSSNPSVAIRNS